MINSIGLLKWTYMDLRWLQFTGAATVREAWALAEVNFQQLFHKWLRTPWDEKHQNYPIASIICMGWYTIFKTRRVSRIVRHKLHGVGNQSNKGNHVLYFVDDRRGIHVFVELKRSPEHSISLPAATRKWRMLVLTLDYAWSNALPAVDRHKLCCSLVTSWSDVRWKCVKRGEEPPVHWLPVKYKLCLSSSSGVMK